MKKSKTMSWGRDFVYDAFLFGLALLPAPVVYRACLSGHIPPRWHLPPRWRRASLFRYMENRNIENLTPAQFSWLSYYLFLCLKEDKHRNAVQSVLERWVDSCPDGVLSLARASNIPDLKDVYAAVVDAAIAQNHENLCVRLLECCFKRVLGLPKFPHTCMTTDQYTQAYKESWMMGIHLPNIVKLLDFVSKGKPLPTVEKPLDITIRRAESLFANLPFQRRDSQGDLDYLKSYLRQIRLSKIVKDGRVERRLPCM